MSITKHPPEPAKGRHSHLRLVSSNGDTIPPATVSDDRQPARPTAYAIFDTLILGFALAGTALHATPESMRLQSELLDAARVQQPAAETGFLRWLKGWFIPWAASSKRANEASQTVTAVKQTRDAETAG